MTKQYDKIIDILNISYKNAGNASDTAKENTHPS